MTRMDMVKKMGNKFLFKWQLQGREKVLKNFLRETDRVIGIERKFMLWQEWTVRFEKNGQGEEKGN